MSSILVFLLVSLINLSNLINYCKIYNNTNFDLQALLAWNYAGSLNLVPHVDLFFPYGILPYFKDLNFFIHFLSFLIVPVLFTGVFIMLKKLWRNWFSYFFFVIFFLFVNRFIGLDPFSRYGIIAVFSLFVGYIFHNNKALNRKIIYLIGVLVGAIFSLMYDQGIYSLIVVLGSMLFHRKQFFSRVIMLVSGLATGLTPFFIYLIARASFADFFVSLWQLLETSLYAKTPFIPYSRSPENIFTFTILFLVISYLSFRFIFERKKLELENYLQLNLVFALVLLEQKSLVRSIDKDLIFISLLLLLVFLKSIIKDLRIVGSYQVGLYVVIFFAIFFGIGLKSYNGISSNSSVKNQCFEENQVHLLKNHPEFYSVKDIILNDSQGMGKVFSFPGDPIFYILFNQIPPYYSNSYDSSPLYAQERQIQYIEDNNVTYIIYNLDISAIQDSVPDIIRVNSEARYIFTHFAVFARVKNFLILKKTSEPYDFFEDKKLDVVAELKEELLNIDLSSIPKSEGRYKAKSLFNTEKMISAKTDDEVNAFLKSNLVDSSSKLIVLSPHSLGGQKNMEINIKTKDNKETVIRFNPCEIDRICIVNLSNIPLFFKDRILDSIGITNFEGEISIVKNSNPGIFW